MSPTLMVGLWAVALIAAALASPVAAQRPPSPVDSLVARFYDQSGGRLAWSDADVVSPQARALLRVLARAGDDGLDPNDYQVAAIDSLFERGIEPDDLSYLDSLLTRAFLQYGSDVSRGRVEPPRVASLWRATPQRMDLVGLLKLALDSGRVVAALRTLAPPQPGYAALRRALARYQEAAAGGGWPVVPAGPPLEPGIRGDRVAALRRRLTAEGYTAQADSEADHFDGGLEAAVREFQERHGLAADGIVGSATLGALNMSAGARLRQISLNLERWRWLPRSLGGRYLVVNSAAFTLDVVDGGQRVLTTRAIVGRPDWPTPIVSSQVRELIFGPAWYVPRGIAARELLPLVQRDPAYLAREGIRVFADSAAGGRELDPTSIDWSAVAESTFAYRLVQDPGPTNPLGRVKLVFWTPFDVFIHDTPTRPLFAERFRAFSHGCVRVEAAADLATYLLPEWPLDSIQAALTLSRERRVRVRASMPVHLVYWTAWTDDRGEVEFRDDAYGWDELLGRALEGRSRTTLQPVRVVAFRRAGTEGGPAPYARPSSDVGRCGSGGF